MNIQLNGENRQSNASNLAAVLEEFGFGGAKVATAVNGEFVPEGMRASKELSPGDRVEVLAPMQGG